MASRTSAGNRCTSSMTRLPGPASVSNTDPSSGSAESSLRDSGAASPRSAHAAASAPSTREATPARSRSSSSARNHATGPPVAAATWAARHVFPRPAGAASTTTGAGSHASEQPRPVDAARQRRRRDLVSGHPPRSLRRLGSRPDRWPSSGRRDGPVLIPALRSKCRGSGRREDASHEW